MRRFLGLPEREVLSEFGEEEPEIEAAPAVPAPEPDPEPPRPMFEPVYGRDKPSDPGASGLHEARLYGCLRSIMEERGMAAAMMAAQRQLRAVAEAARCQGRSLDGFIG